jgi:hypothetical protein
MKTRNRRNKKKATRKKGGMFRSAAKTVGKFALEVGKSESQDIFKEKVKGWENSVNNNIENQENIKINNNKPQFRPVNSQLYNYQNQL